jgi:hypothetical protein
LSKVMIITIQERNTFTGQHTSHWMGTKQRCKTSPKPCSLNCFVIKSQFMLVWYCQNKSFKMCSVPPPPKKKEKLNPERRCLNVFKEVWFFCYAITD